MTERKLPMSKEQASKARRKETLYVMPSPFWHEDYPRQLREYSKRRDSFERILDKIVQNYWEQLRLHMYRSGSEKGIDRLRSVWTLEFEIKKRLDELHALLTHPEKLH
jgi:hypothetical protein